MAAKPFADGCGSFPVPVSSRSPAGVPACHGFKSNRPGSGRSLAHLQEVHQWAEFYSDEKLNGVDDSAGTFGERVASELLIETCFERQMLSEGVKDMKTGTDAKEKGLYVSECCSIEKVFSPEQTFTRCPKCSSLTIWEIAEVDLPKAA